MSDQKPNDEEKPIEIGVGYPAGQLAKALITADTHEDESVRARAVKKIEKWIGVINGILTGALSVGSRTPIQDVPAWATPEVAHGGFATGKLTAEGPISLSEELLIYRVCPGAVPGSERGRLNSYFLSDEGILELQGLLSSRRYRVAVPEEGALLVVAWLLKHVHTEEARNLIDTIGPFMGRFRFYPVFTDDQPGHGEGLFRQPITTTIADLKKTSPAPQIEAQREAVGVWLPLYDQLVALISETVVDGWPCQNYPDGWQARAKALLTDYDNLMKKHRLCAKRHDPSRGGMGLLRNVLRKAIDNPKQLTGLEVSRARKVLHSIETKRGLPGSEQTRRLRALQAPTATRLTTKEQSQIIIRRLSQVEGDDAIADIDVFLQPLTADEMAQLQFPIANLQPTQTISPTLKEKLLRSKRGTLDELMALGVIPSAEVLATMIPQLTGDIRSADIEDAELRDLYVAVYKAFRRRRSLLLLYYANQVKFNELPWAVSMESRRRAGKSKTKALESLHDVVSATLIAFPHQILPNKLLPEIRELAAAAEVRLRITDELAADIFMGNFTQKFLRAAQTAARLLNNTLYHRYYDAPFQRVLAMKVHDEPDSAPDSNTVKYVAKKVVLAEEFGDLCRKLADLDSVTSRSPVARNGRVIEQQLILTTHNLAVLFDALDLRESLRDQLPAMAQKCFRWILRCHQQKIDVYRSFLHMVKNTAYAWRQMVFYLSMMPDAEVDQFLSWASEHLSQQQPRIKERFEPLLSDLIRARAGESVSSEHRFLGWSNRWQMTEVPA